MVLFSCINYPLTAKDIEMESLLLNELFFKFQTAKVEYYFFCFKFEQEKATELQNSASLILY